MFLLINNSPSTGIWPGTVLVTNALGQCYKAQVSISSMENTHHPLPGFSFARALRAGILISYVLFTMKLIHLLAWLVSEGFSAHNQSLLNQLFTYPTSIVVLLHVAYKCLQSTGILKLRAQKS